MIRRVEGSDDTLAIDIGDFPTLFFHVFCCHVRTLWVSVTCSYESSVFLTRSGNVAFRDCLQSVCIFLSLTPQLFDTVLIWFSMLPVLVSVLYYYTSCVTR